MKEGVAVNDVHATAVTGPEMTSDESLAEMFVLISLTVIMTKFKSLYNSFKRTEYKIQTSLRNQSLKTGYQGLKRVGCGHSI